VGSRQQIGPCNYRNVRGDHPTAISLDLDVLNPFSR
jgi:hypothetical protein